MSDVSGIPYMGPMGQGNFFAPSFSYNPQLTAGAIQSAYMPEAIQNQNVFNNLYASGGGFGRQTDYYSQLGAGYSAAGMSPYGVFTDPGYGGGGGGGASPYQTSSNVWDTGASGFGYPGAGGIDWSMFQQQASPYQSSSNVFSGGASPFNYSGAGLDWSNLFQPSQSSQSPFSAGNFGAGMFGGLAGGIGGTYQGQNNSMDWSNLFGGGAAKADPYSGMKMPGGLGSSMATPQQQPTDYSSLFGRGVGGAGQDTSSPYEAPKPSAGDLGGGMFGGLGGAGAGPGSSAIDWSKLFGGNEAKTDPAPGMTMPGGLGTPLGREQPADFSSRFGDWGKQPSGVRGEIVPEERNTTSNMYTIPAGGGVFGGGGGAESQLYGANAGSLGGDGGLGFNPITGTGPKGDTADSLAEQARARLAELMNDKGDKTIELKAEPGGMIGPPDPREAPDYNPFAGEKIPLPQARPEGADAPRPPAGMPERPGERQAYEAPPRPQGDLSLVNSPTMRGVNPRLVAAVQGGASFLPPGYSVEAVSGVREGKAQSYHSGGRAADFRIVGPDGPIPHKGEDDTGMYTLLARGVKTWTQQNDPQLAQQMGYGGAFGTQLGGGGVPDLMHYDLGGSRGRMVPDVQFGNLKPLSEAERNAMPAYIPLLGANQVGLDTGPSRVAPRADVNQSQEIPRPPADIPASEAVPLPAPRPNAEANLSQAHSLLDTKIIDLVQKNSPSQASMVPSSIANQPLREALDNTFTGGMIRSNITPQQLAKAGITQADFDKAYAQGRPQQQRFGGDFGSAGGELPSPGAFKSYEGFGQSHPDFENRTAEQLGRDQLAQLQTSYEPLPEVASTPLGAGLGLEMLGGGDISQGDAAQQLTAKYGPEALWAAQGQSQFPQGQTQPLGGNDVSRMPYTQQSPVPGATFPVQLYDDPRYGQASLPPAEAPPQPFPGASEVTQQPYQPARFDEGNPFFSPIGGAGGGRNFDETFSALSGERSPQPDMSDFQSPANDYNTFQQYPFIPPWQASIKDTVNSPEMRDAIQQTAQQQGVRPPAIAGVVNTEDPGWNPRLRDPDSPYVGLTQIGPDTWRRPGMPGTTWEDYSQRFTGPEQIQAYSQWLDSYGALDRARAAGIDINALSDPEQAALLQAFQFSPNAGLQEPGVRDWLTPYTRGNADMATTLTKNQAPFLVDPATQQPTMNTMTDYYRRLMADQVAGAERRWPQQQLFNTYYPTRMGGQ